MAKEKVKSPLTWAREYSNLFGWIKGSLNSPPKKLIFWKGNFYEWKNGFYEIDADIDEKIRSFVASGGVSPTQKMVNNIKYNLRGFNYLPEKKGIILRRGRIMKNDQD